MARDHEEKLRSVMYLDSKKEQDLIQYVTELKRSHKLGEFIAICIRTCWENPEYLAKAGYTTEQCGMTDKRVKFFNEANRRMNEMRYKVDSIYDMALKEYALAQFGKRIGLPEKSKNLLQAEFILRKQIDDISRTLGITNLGKTWDALSGATDRKAEELLELIIESYDNILSELKDSIMQPVIIEKEKGVVESKPQVQKQAKQIQQVQQIQSENIMTEDNTEKPKEFGEGADLGLLEQFLGL